MQLNFSLFLNFIVRQAFYLKNVVTYDMTPFNAERGRMLNIRTREGEKEVAREVRVSVCLVEMSAGS